MKVFTRFLVEDYLKAVPSNKERLLLAWIEIHKEDLMTNWQLAINGVKVSRIDPLR